VSGFYAKAFPGFLNRIHRIVVCKIMLALEREIAQAFSDAENSIKEKLAYNE